MRPTYTTLTGVANGAVIPMNTYASPFNVGFGVSVTGTITYKVQHTFDDIYSSTFNASTATWFEHPTTGSAGLSTATDGNYAFPVNAIRIITTAGTGSVTLKLIQAGSAAAS